jgi:hypothetical protein
LSNAAIFKAGRHSSQMKTPVASAACDQMEPGGFDQMGLLAVPFDRKRVVRGASIKCIGRPADSSWTAYAVGDWR